MPKIQLNINEENLLYNLNYYKAKTNKKIIAVIKANAYGHGYELISKILSNNNIYMFATSNIFEAILLRKNHIKKDILILEPVDNFDIKTCIFYNFIISITNLKQFLYINKLGLKNKIKIKLKIDTGMHRLGLNYDEVLVIKELLKGNKNIILKGLFTHLIGNELEHDFLIKQRDEFRKIIALFNEQNLDISMCSSSNLKYDFEECNCVRIGLGLYGLIDNLKPILELKSPIINIYNIKKDECALYHNSFKSRHDGYLYTILLGYSHGFLLNDKLKIFINNKSYKIVNLKCMNMMSFFAKEKYEIGQYVTIFNEKHSLLEYAKNNKRSPYEVASNLGQFLMGE